MCASGSWREWEARRTRASATGEFSARGGNSIPELKERLRGIVKEAAAVIGAVTPERLAERVVIQKYEVSVLEAIYHVVEHFSLHTGQIIFATKMLTGADMGFYPHLRSSAVHGGEDAVGTEIPLQQTTKDDGLSRQCYSPSSSGPTLSTARNASCGISTRPTRFMRFLPSFCFSSSLRLREMSPP